MLQKISHKAFQQHGPIKILYPGLSLSNADSGIGSIGRIDHASVRGRQRIGMHPHANDEILSYFRAGKVEHIDSEGYRDTIVDKRLMLMKAGKLFYHEELIDGQIEPFEGLQIFIRPGGKDLKPEVIFQDLEQVHSENEWRLLASPGLETPLRFSSETWLYDMKMSPETIMGLPVLPAEGLTALLYVYQGAVTINQNITLEKQEALVIKDERILISATKDAELVLFLTDEQAPIFKGGMYSGNNVTPN